MRKFKFGYNLARLTSTLREDLFIFLMTLRSGLFRMKKFHTNFVEKIKAHILC